MRSGTWATTSASTQARVSAFYASNVEVYLNRQQTAAFCGNLAALPSDSRTWFIGSKGIRALRSKLKACAAGRVR